jgi:outer membrane receptor protein involved in Fe transport
VEFQTLASVGRKTPWEYWIQSPFYWDGNVQVGSENNPYFATHGDFPRYSKRRASTYTWKSDLSSRRWNQHRAKAGFEAKYNRVENLTLTLPNTETNGLPGGNRSDYVNYNPEGSAYAQDRWEFEGLVLNAGLRYDLFTPGDQISDADLRSGRRYKQQLSPRLGVAYPISDKDVLSFHYGWTYQTPARGAIFENRGLGATVNTRGNPDLEPETNVAYQAAMQHLFSRDVSGQFSVFFRDIYGLITARRETDEFGNLVNVFANGDYASARGFEASVTKSFSHKFSADVHYTYSLATGVASDPNSALQFLNGGRLFLPISERALDWDQRHTLSFQANLRDAGKWGMRTQWTWGSGFPFTPSFRNDRRRDPSFENSRRLPSNSTLTIDADKFYRVWGQDVTLFVTARNVLDAVNIADPSPNNGGFPNPFINAGGQDDYLVYYTETGRAGGGYLQDLNGDGSLDWVPVHDPRVYEEGRNVRMGVSIVF